MEKYNCNFIKMDVSSSCNLSCPLCPNSYRRKGLKIPYRNMPLTEFMKFFNNLKVHPKEVGLGVNHEPLMNNDIFDIIKFINNVNKEIDVTLSTNFNLSNKFKTETIVNSGVRSIFIGLDGIDQESYSKYRIGGNFNIVIDSIKKIQEYKKQKKLEFPQIKIIFIVFKYNEHLIDKAKTLFNSLGISVFFRRTDFYAGFEEWFPLEFKQNNYNENNGTMCNNETDVICMDPFSSITIDSFGDVYPCCGDSSFNFVVGNIFKESFENVWYSKKMEDIRLFLQKKYNIKDIPCINCPVYKKDNNNIAIKL